MLPLMPPSSLPRMWPLGSQVNFGASRTRPAMPLPGVDQVRFGRKTPHYKAVIVGGGVAGMTAAYELGKTLKGGSGGFLLLEGERDLGGNSRKSGKYQGVDYPKGASVFRVGRRIHRRLWKELGILKDTFRLRRPDVLVSDGKIFPVDPSLAANPHAPDDLRQLMRRYRQFLKELNSLDHNDRLRPVAPIKRASARSLAVLDGISLGYYLRQKGYEDIIPLIKPVIESDFAASVDEVSAYAALNDLMGDTTQDYLLPGGNYHLIETLREKILRRHPGAIQTGARVTGVTQQAGKAFVEFENDGKTRRISADYVLLGVPYHRVAELAPDYPRHDVMTSLPRSTYALVNIFLKRLPEGLEANRFYLTPKASFSDFIVTTGDKPGSPAVVTIYAPHEGGRTEKENRAYGKAVAREFLALFRDSAVRVRAGDVAGVNVNAYAESMAAPAPGQVAQLKSVPRKHGRILLIHSDGGAIPSSLTAVDQAMDGVKRVQKLLAAKGGAASC